MERNEDQAVRAAQAAQSDVPSAGGAGALSGKERTQFKKGQSGNPRGRPKRTEAEKDYLEGIRAMVPDAIREMSQMLKSKKIAAVAKVRLIEIILERTYGKPEASVRVTSLQDSVNAARARLDAVFAEALIEDKTKPEAEKVAGLIVDGLPEDAAAPEAEE